MGNVYVADKGNDRVQGFTSSGVAFVTWTSNNVEDVAVDGSDNVWTAGGNAVTHYAANDGSVLDSWLSMSGADGIEVAPDGTVWISLATSVAHYDVSKNLLGTISGFSSPEGLDVGADGTLYVADSDVANALSGSVDVYSTPSLETAWLVGGVKGVAVDGASVLSVDGGEVGTYDTAGLAGNAWSSPGAYGIAPDGAGNYLGVVHYRQRRA